MLQMTCPVETYLMPADGYDAKLRLLSLMQKPVEKWVILYEASMQEFWDTITFCLREDHIVHVYADHSLATRPTEKKSLFEIKSAGADVVIGTSTTSKFFIAHSKIVAFAPADSQNPGIVWEGSTNFSEASWSECNTAIVVQSTAYQEAVRDQWNALANFARKQEGAWQL